MMTPEHFFDLFIEELKSLPELSHYYKFLSSEKDFEFRKNYFIQRLEYIYSHVQEQQKLINQPLSIWDCGCGYGTTCLFLAMNGFKSYGSTLEFYFEYLPKRKEYWSAFGDSALFTADYEDIYDNPPAKNKFDIAIIQDTLHHLEPIDDAIAIIHDSLHVNGIAICIEENGDNIIQNAKLYKQRGSKRIITFWDEKLQKNITMGNENIRGMNQWRKIFSKKDFKILDSETQYIRVLPPYFYKNKIAEEVALTETKMSHAILKKYFYFGINFIARKLNS